MRRFIETAAVLLLALPATSSESWAGAAYDWALPKFLIRAVVFDLGSHIRT